MTLVIFIPYNEGGILISDRQNTYGDGSIEPIDKIAYIEELNVVSGFAGDTTKCMYLLDKLKEETDEEIFLEHYRRVYEECYGRNALEFTNFDTKLLTLLWLEDGLNLYRIFGATPNRLPIERCYAIGSGSRHIIPHMQIDTLEREVGEVEKFGTMLLEYSHRCDNTIGSPISYGYNIALMNADETSLDTKHCERLEFEKIQYHF